MLTAKTERVAPRGTRGAETVLGPGSLSWRYLGDQRTLLVAAPYGMLQLMHPAVGAGVTEHSDFFSDPWDRVLRSIPEIIGTVYDPPGSGTGTQVRDYHHNIKGVDEQGRRYHALDPEVYFWTHATMVAAVIALADVFDQGLTDAQRETLYQESKEWYRRYGVSDRPMPGTYAEFQDYFTHMCDTILEATRPHAGSPTTSTTRSPSNCRTCHRRSSACCDR